MAKGKRKRGKKHKGKGGLAAGAALGGGALGAAFWAQLIRETVGNFAGQLMADGAEQMAKGNGAAGKGGDDDDEPQDVAADVLRVLAESGPKPIADLITETGAGLTELLRALEQVRAFRLVELVGDEQVVQLTSEGTRTASALRREQINAEGMKLLSQ